MSLGDWEVVQLYALTDDDGQPVGYTFSCDVYEAAMLGRLVWALLCALPGVQS